MGIFYYISYLIILFFPTFVTMNNFFLTYRGKQQPQKPREMQRNCDEKKD